MFFCRNVKTQSFSNEVNRIFENVQVVEGIVVQFQKQTDCLQRDVDRIESGQGASHRNLRVGLPDGWEWSGSQTRVTIEVQAREMFQILRERLQLSMIILLSTLHC